MRQRGIGPGPRWVVVCLAERMNHRTGKCFPSLATLAGDTGFSEDTVRRHLQSLVAAGLIDIERTEGGSNDYRLHLNAGTPPAKYGGDPPQNATPPLAKSPPPPSQNTGGDPPQNATLTREGDNQGREPRDVLDPTTCSSPTHTHRAKPRDARDQPPPEDGLFGPAAAPAAAPASTQVATRPKRDRLAIREADAFDQFWILYPRKEGKGAARKEWDLVVRKTPGTLIVEALRARLPHFSDDPRYVPHPRTWLHQERWTDEIASLERTARSAPISAAEQMLQAAGISPADVAAAFGTTPEKAH